MCNNQNIHSLFEELKLSVELPEILRTFNSLGIHFRQQYLDPEKMDRTQSVGPNFMEKFLFFLRKSVINARPLCDLLEKKAKQKEYSGAPCRRQHVVVIGGLFVCKLNPLFLFHHIVTDKFYSWTSRFTICNGIYVTGSRIGHSFRETKELHTP
jgi:hypothetical protein